MRSRKPVQCLAIAALAALPFWGQDHKSQAMPPAPQLVFTLQTPQKSPKLKIWSMKMVAVPPDPVIKAERTGDGLLVLLPQADGSWQLQRLTGWLHGTPGEHSLSFSAPEFTNDQDLQQPEILPSPDVKRGLVRVLLLALDGDTWKRSAVLVLVDLPSMTVVWQRSTTAPLLADSRLAFADETLVAVEGTGPVQHRKFHLTEIVPDDILARNPLAAGDHRAELLSFPGLERREACMYTVKRRPDEPDEATVLEEDPAVEAVGGEAPEAGATVEVVPNGPAQGFLLADGCAELVKTVGVRSAEDLPGLRQMRAREGRPFWPGCALEDESTDGSLNVSNCRQGTMTEKNGFGTRSEEERVTASWDGRTLFTFPLRPNEKHSSTLATAGGRHYLVMLRKNLRVEALEIHARDSVVPKLP